MTPDEDFFELNISFDGETVEKIKIPIPPVCPHCDKEVAKTDTLWELHTLHTQIFGHSLAD